MLTQNISELSNNSFNQSDISTTSANSTDSANFKNSLFSGNNTQLVSLLANLLQLIAVLIQNLEQNSQNTSDNTNQNNSSDLSCKDKCTLSGIDSVVPFNTAIGKDEPGPIAPGDTVEIDFTAEPGQNISFASMFGPTNDYFFAPGESGISVYDEDGQARTGDITSEVHLWDAGTEADETPFEGQFQTMDRDGNLIAEAQTGPADDNNTVRRADNSFGLADVDQMVKVELVHKGGDEFSFRLTNVSDQLVDQGAISPGMLAVHDSNVNPLFDEGVADRGWGLEGIAEDGNPAAMIENYKKFLADLAD